MKVVLVLIVAGKSSRTQTIECGFSRGWRLKVFPPSRKSHTLDAKPNVGRSRISDASKVEDDDGMLEIGLKEVVTLTGTMLFEVEVIQMSD